jgi:hypothetical protein
MRTTVDLPDDLHAVASSLAHDRRQSLSRTIVELVRRGLENEVSASVSIDEASGWPIVHVGRPITSEDVRRIDDE